LPRMTYDEAMRRFGHDAPDLRFGLEIVDVTDLAAGCGFRVFEETAAAGKFVRGICAPGGGTRYSRKGIDGLTVLVRQDFGAKGLAFFRVEPDGSVFSPIAKTFQPERLAALVARFAPKPGDLLLLVADTWEISCKALYGLRKRLGAELELYNP